MRAYKSLVLSAVIFYGLSEAGFLWFEMAPNGDDPCVLTVLE